MVNRNMAAMKVQVRCGCVCVSDGKRRPVSMRLRLTTELLKLQKVQLESNYVKIAPVTTKERAVVLTRDEDFGLGFSIKGGVEHKLPIMVSRVHRQCSEDDANQLFVGDAVIKVNTSWLTSRTHDETLEILRRAGNQVTLLVKHYPAATPFLQRTGSGENYLNQIDDVRIVEYATEEEEEKASSSTKYLDVITVPLMMAYVTRYIFGTDKLRPNAFEVRGLNGTSTGIIHCADSATSSQWLKNITDNITGLTNLQIKLHNRNFSQSERIDYMGWVNEGNSGGTMPWLSYKPRFLTIKGTDVLLFDTPPLNVVDWLQCGLIFKVCQTMFRTVKDSEHKDERQHCFMIQTCGEPSMYLSVETRQELLRIEAAWHAAVCSTVAKIGSKTFAVKWNNRTCTLILDWNYGFILKDADTRTSLWSYRFSQLKGSSDDGNFRLKLHFQQVDTKIIETKELECNTLQNVLFCMHAFLTAKVASVDPAFLSFPQAI